MQLDLAVSARQRRRLQEFGQGDRADNSVLQQQVWSVPARLEVVVSEMTIDARLLCGGGDRVHRSKTLISDKPLPVDELAREVASSVVGQSVGLKSLTTRGCRKDSQYLVDTLPRVQTEPG